MAARRFVRPRILFNYVFVFSHVVIKKIKSNKNIYDGRSCKRLDNVSALMSGV